MASPVLSSPTIIPSSASVLPLSSRRKGGRFVPLPVTARKRWLERELPQVEILMFSGTRSRRALLQMYRSGVGGCLLKSEGAEELLAALESLRQHQRFRSRQITELNQTIAQAARDLDTLTARETATLRLMVDAKSSKEIAVQLGISIKTVETHRTNLFRKLKVRSVAELVRYALRQGLVDI
jgi:DNA-binding NarL/FixJ family response regulator